MPIDNVQRFEWLRDDALYLQGLADKGADIDEINELTNILRTDIQYGFPVSLTGGLIEVGAINEDLQETRMFVPNETEVSGVYQGMTWRPEAIAYPDGTSEVTWRLCHSIGAEDVAYTDFQGNGVKLTPVSNITTEGSNIELMSPIGIHDYRRIALDGVCLKIDQIAMDDDIELHEKAERIAKLFRILNPEEKGPEKARDIRQRVSYLNELGLFDDSLVSSPIAISRQEDETTMLKAEEGNIMAKIQYVSIDEAVSDRGEWIDRTSCISYEIELPDFGHVSVPHIPGITKIYNLV